MPISLFASAWLPILSWCMAQQGIREGCSSSSKQLPPRSVVCSSVCQMWRTPHAPLALMSGSDDDRTSRSYCNAYCMRVYLWVSETNIESNSAIQNYRTTANRPKNRTRIRSLWCQGLVQFVSRKSTTWMTWNVKERKVGICMEPHNEGHLQAKLQVNRYPQGQRLRG